MTHDGFGTAIHGRRIATSVLVLVGLLMSACTSSTSSASSPSPVEGTMPPANGAMVDIDTGKITPLPASIATSGALYAVLPTTRPPRSTSPTTRVAPGRIPSSWRT